MLKLKFSQEVIQGDITSSSVAVSQRQGYKKRGTRCTHHQFLKMSQTQNLSSPSSPCATQSMDSPTSPPPSPSILPPASPESPRVFEENSQALLEGDDDAQPPINLLTQKGGRKREVEEDGGEEVTSSSPPATDASDEDEVGRVPVATVKMYTHKADTNGNTRQ